jgi:hypothetical protein
LLTHAAGSTTLPACRLRANGALVADTAATGKPLVVITGRRPLTGGLSPGAEEALFSMRAGAAPADKFTNSLATGAQSFAMRAGAALATTQPNTQTHEAYCIQEVHSFSRCAMAACMTTCLQ